MIESTEMPGQTLEKLVDEICSKIEEGQQIDLEQFVDSYPEFSKQLRELYPALLALNSLDKTCASPQQLTGVGLDSEKLGDFQILRQIGRGGMGVVYEAQQLSIPRKVALKILPLASLVDHRALQRFKNEVAAIATLEHPHIVSVYAIGEDRGIHYFAMQLVNGQSLANVIQELKARADHEQAINGGMISQVISEMDQGASGEKKRAFSETRAKGASGTSRVVGDQTYFRNAARLALRATEAIQHAHDHGIVHRDVKPGNLLLDAKDGLFVTDFGLARMESAAGVTITGDVMGTLRYMSPEQVLANRVVIDHRTDVYSLGATLYELLTLQPMWPGANRAELIRQISFEEPTLPQKVNPAIPTDLETIVLKATNKNPNDRYDDAQSFANDLQRFLDNKSVVAKRPTPTQRIAKWARRNPMIVWSMAIGLIFISLAAVTSAAVVWQANEKTRQALDEKSQQHQRAEQNFDIAWNTVEQMLDRVADELENTPHMQPLRQELLEQALKFYRGFVDQRSDDRQVQYQSAHAQIRLGRAYRMLGRPKDAEAAFVNAISEAKTIDDATADSRCAELLSDGHYRLGSVFESVGDYSSAITQLRNSEAYWNTLIAAAPDSDKSRVGIANVYCRLAEIDQKLSDHDLGEDYVRKGLDVLEHVSDPNYQEQVWMVESMLEQHSSRAAKNRGNQETSIIRAKRAVELVQQVLERDPKNRSHRVTLALYYNNLAIVLNDEDEKIQAREQALKISRSLVSDFPSIPDYQVSLADATKDWARVLVKMNRHQEAEKLFLESIERTVELRNSDVVRNRALFAQTRSQFSQMLIGQNRFDEAIVWLSEAIPVWTDLYENDAPRISFNNLSFCQSLISVAIEKSGKSFESKNLPNLQQYLIDRATREGATHWECFEVARSLLGIDYSWGAEPDLGARLARRACEMGEDKADNNWPAYLSTLGMAQHQTGETEQGIETTKRAISTCTPETPKWLIQELNEHLQTMQASIK